MRVVLSLAFAWTSLLQSEEKIPVAVRVTSDIESLADEVNSYLCRSLRDIKDAEIVAEKDSLFDLSLDVSTLELTPGLRRLLLLVRVYRKEPPDQSKKGWNSVLADLKKPLLKPVLERTLSDDVGNEERSMRRLVAVIDGAIFERFRLELKGRKKNVDVGCIPPPPPGYRLEDPNVKLCPEKR